MTEQPDMNQHHDTDDTTTDQTDADLYADEDDEDDVDYDEDEPAYGQPGSMENPDLHVKWICDGASTLTAMALELEAYAKHCRDLEARGWQLSEPVDNSHGFVEWKGEGSPPPVGWARTPPMRDLYQPVWFEQGNSMASPPIQRLGPVFSSRALARRWVKEFPVAATVRIEKVPLRERWTDVRAIR